MQSHFKTSAARPPPSGVTATSWWRRCSPLPVLHLLRSFHLLRARRDLHRSSLRSSGPLGPAARLHLRLGPGRPCHLFPSAESGMRSPCGTLPHQATGSTRCWRVPSSVGTGRCLGRRSTYPAGTACRPAPKLGAGRSACPPPPGGPAVQRVQLAGKETRAACGASARGDGCGTDGENPGRRQGVRKRISVGLG